MVERLGTDCNDDASYREGHTSAASSDVCKSRHGYLARLGFYGRKSAERKGGEEGTTATVRRPRTLRSPLSVTLLLLDWDDTLFCTSALHHLHQRPDTRLQYGKALSRLGAASHNILSLCCSLGQTIIVTNAQGGWVESCAEKYLPELRSDLAQIPVLSARDRFERVHPGDPVAWKCAMFAELRENSGQIANLVAIGDQEAEMEAVARLARLYHTAFVKSIRMMKSPTVHQLSTQLELLLPKLPRIVHCARHLSISLKQKSGNPRGDPAQEDT